jgi:tryptophan 2,3-dioxygenase
MDEPVTYSGYLRLDQLLSAQQPRSGEHDEMLFIVIHQVCELLVDLDEGLQEWRYRHVKMVQRTIGGRHGTGGSAGATYLTTTLSNPTFPDLWAMRSLG